MKANNLNGETGCDEKDEYGPKEVTVKKKKKKKITVKGNCRVILQH